ncbi:MAG: hypothetical protein JNL21_35070 [Myxococcales bacterium]|nr:hypothetical protein [Myxococcales bacterium]
MVRLRAILQSLAAVRYGLLEHTFEGDGAAGSYAEDDGCGNHHVVFWNAHGVVMLSFDHDSPESEAGMARAERTPEARLPDVPPALRGLARRACEHGERLATDGCWILGNQRKRGGIDERFPRYDESPEAVLADWLAEGPLEASYGQLALALLIATASGSYTLTEEDVLALPLQIDGPAPDPDAVAQAVAQLVRLGIHWPGAVEQAKARHAAELQRAPLVAEVPLPAPHATAQADLVAQARKPPTVPVVFPDTSIPGLDPGAIEEKLPALLDIALDMLPRGGRSIAYPALEEAWVLTRSPRIADVLDCTWGWDRLPYPGRTGNVREVEQKLAAYLAEPSWRASREVLHFLTAGVFFANKDEVRRAEETAAAVLVAMRDVRYAEPLAEHCARNRPDPNPAPIRESLLFALRALQTFEPPALGAANEAKLDVIGDLINGWRVSPGKRLVNELIQAVYDDPRDLEVRKELATRLVESDDPRGELMQLQLARHGTGKRPKKREGELLAENRSKWLGEIARAVAESDDVFQNGFLWQAATGEGGVGRNAAQQHLILITGAGAQREWSTVERLTVWRHFRFGTTGLLGGKRLYNLRELTDIGTEELAALAEGSERPLEVLELGQPRTYQGWAGEIYHARLGDTLDRLPNLRELRLGGMQSSLETVEALARRAKALRVLTLSVGTQRLLPSLVAMAQELGLEEIGTLAINYDLSYDLVSRTLQFACPRLLHDNIAIAASKRIRELTSPSPLRVVVRTSARSKPRGSTGDPSRPPVLVRGKTESMDLTPIWEAAAAMGATCELAPYVAHWSKSPDRDA